MKNLVAIIATAAVTTLAGGCNGPSQLQADLQHEDPAVRMKAISRAGNTADTAAVPFLVDRLTDSQKDVRFFAIIALERITGQTMGWNHYDPPNERAQAVQRWRQWLKEEYGHASGDSGQATDIADQEPKEDGSQ